MDIELPFSNWSLRKLLLTEPDRFNKSRIKIIYVILLMAILKIVVLLPVAYYKNQDFQFGRGLLILLVYGGLLKMLLWRKSYIKILSHIAICGGIILVWSSALVSVVTINIIAIQLVVMIIMTSFYLLDNRFGIIYSIISSMPIILYMGLFGRDNSLVIISPVTPVELASPAYEIIVFLNFMTLALAHYLFHEAFTANIKEKSILNEELHEAVEKANKSAQSKADFLSTMSHELRTPLNSVIGMTELLLDDPHSENQKENLSVLKFSAVSLHSLINDILDYNKIESDKLSLEATRVNVHELIDNICAGLRIQAKEKGLNLILNIHDDIKGQFMITDPIRITQIIYNLVGNGIKFTKTGGVTVSLDRLNRTSENMLIRFSIVDTGIGISPDKHEAIFEPFIQASGNTTRNFGGTGLGLAIVKRLLSLFESMISLESSDQGSTFFFDISFKLDGRAVEDSVSEIETVYDLTGLKVLVAEDNPINVLLLKKILAKWNVEPIFTGNGLDAVNALSAGDFDVILMDIHMPVMDGYQATHNIRNLSDPAKAAICIIALTASVSNLERRIKEVGMDDYIYKPFNSKELFVKLKKIKK
jgi:signal transduction histidine kinase/CheY-like chemotaxis protein